MVILSLLLLARKRDALSLSLSFFGACVCQEGFTTGGGENRREKAKKEKTNTKKKKDKYDTRIHIHAHIYIYT